MSGINENKGNDRLDEIIKELYLEEIEEQETDIDIDKLLNGAYEEIQEKEKIKKNAGNRKRRLKYAKIAAICVGIAAVALTIFRPE